MTRLVIALMLVAQAPALATLMVVPPAGGAETVFVLPGNVWNTTQTLLLSQFSISGSPTWAYTNSSYYGFGTTGWTGAGFNYITPHFDNYTITINLGGTYASVGGLFATEAPNSNVSIRALGASMNVLETYAFASTNPIYVYENNTGGFRGIDTGTQNIHYLQITGPILMHSITLGPGALDAAGPDPGLSETPEPATMGLVLIAASIFAARRRVPRK